jgi:hypothetical protein
MAIVAGFDVHRAQITFDALERGLLFETTAWTRSRERGRQLCATPSRAVARPTDAARSHSPWLWHTGRPVQPSDHPSSLGVRRQAPYYLPRRARLPTSTATTVTR